MSRELLTMPRNEKDMTTHIIIIDIEEEPAVQSMIDDKYPNHELWIGYAESGNQPARVVNASEGANGWGNYVENVRRDVLDAIAESKR